MNANEQLKAIIDDLLDMATLENGEINVRCEALDCLEIMTQVYRTLELPAKDRGIQFSVDTSATLPSVLADRGRLLQVLLNLGYNAIKYNMRGGWVLLAAFPHDGMIRFFVRDTGKGIAPADHDQIFQPFNRLGAKHGPDGGAGVGLAVSRRLVRAMRGEIGFESVVGAGSKFWIDLPVAAETAVAKSVTTRGAAMPDEAHFKILYIEDRLPSIELMRSIVDELDHTHFLDAQTVKDGIEVARSAKPDLVITDIHLPDGTGFDVLQRLRADPETSRMTVIALTADAMPINIHKMSQAGFDHVLTKPFNVADLVEIIRAVAKAA